MYNYCFKPIIFVIIYYNFIVLCLSDGRHHNKQNDVLYIRHVPEFYIKLSLDQPDDGLFNPKLVAIQSEKNVGF